MAMAIGLSRLSKRAATGEEKGERRVEKNESRVEKKRDKRKEKREKRRESGIILLYDKYHNTVSCVMCHVSSRKLNQYLLPSDSYLLISILPSQAFVRDSVLPILALLIIIILVNHS